MKLELEDSNPMGYFEINPDMPGFEVLVEYTPKEDLKRLNKKATVKQPGRGGLEERTDNDLFVANACTRFCRGWRGLTEDYLRDLVNLKQASIDALDRDDAGNIAYSEDLCRFLAKHTSDTVFMSPLMNFSTTLGHMNVAEAARKNAESADSSTISESAERGPEAAASAPTSE